MATHTNTPENIIQYPEPTEPIRNPIPATFETSAKLAEIFGSVDRVHLEASIRMCLMHACRPEESERIEAFVQSYMGRLKTLDSKYATAKEAIEKNTESKKDTLLASLESDKLVLFSRAQTQIALNTLALDGKARASVGQAMEGAPEIESPLEVVAA
jgi:hypothetical protein